MHKTFQVLQEFFSSTFEFIYFPTEMHINNIFIEDHCKIITKSKVVYGISLVAWKLSDDITLKYKCELIIEFTTINSHY